MPALPARPSAEHLRKRAKRLARESSIALAEAQRELAQGYGFPSWTALIREVERLRAAGRTQVSPLYSAVRSRDVQLVAQLLAEGANPRLGDGREPPLHLAARLGPLPLVEALIAAGALVWQPDDAGRSALDAARRGRTRDRAAIVALLDRGRIAEPSFRAAVAAIHAGDMETLSDLLAARPQLLHERNIGAQAYRMAKRFDYFRDPKLFWFIANNPTSVERMPANIVDVARVMIERGVERDDLTYTLELVMTSLPAREQGHQAPLMRLLIGAGAVVERRAILMTAGHRELGALRALLAEGSPMSAPIAAALGDAALAALLADADRDDTQTAFGLAVINGHLAAARLALDAGADVNAFLPVHAHSTALHQATADGHVDLIRFLLTRGARCDIRDTLWDATPLGWATWAKNEAAKAALSGDMV